MHYPPAIAVGKHLGVSDKAIAAGLEKFQGAGRRFQLYGELDFGKGKATVGLMIMAIILGKLPQH